jgi:hypothetical protein
MATSLITCGNCGVLGTSNQRGCPCRDNKVKLEEAFTNKDIHGVIPAFAVKFGDSIIQFDEIELNQRVLSEIMYKQTDQKRSDIRGAVLHSITKRHTKNMTTAAKKEAIRKQTEARRLLLEQQAADAERAALLELEDEQQHKDQAAMSDFLSSARTCQSNSTTGLSGYTESLSGFKPPGSESSYMPSEAPSSVAREPPVLRSAVPAPAPAPAAAPSVSSSWGQSARNMGHAAIASVKAVAPLAPLAAALIR